jgi:hypothetical protein
MHLRDDLFDVLYEGRFVKRRILVDRRCLILDRDRVGCIGDDVRVVNDRADLQADGTTRRQAPRWGRRGRSV